MLVEKLECLIPDDSVTVWRFMSMGKFIDCVINSSIDLTRIDKFKDPFEGALAIGNLQRARTIDRFRHIGGPSMFEAWTRIVQVHVRRTTFANCWYMSEYESAAMWDLYGRDAIAVKSSIGQIKASLLENDDREIFIGAVRYIDYNDPASQVSSRVESMAFSKRLSFQHEAELRIVHVDSPSDDELLTYDWSTHPVGHKFGVRLQTLMSSVHLYPGSQPWASANVKALLALLHMPEINVYVSDLYDPITLR